MRKGIIITLIGILILGAGLGIFSFQKYNEGNKVFVADGYMLDPSLKEVLTDDAYNLYNFTEGSSYREKYGLNVEFKDANGNDKSVSVEHFMHYVDGSLGAFTKGALVDVTSFGEENYSYYSVTQNTILVKNGSNYELSCKGDKINLQEFLWKISDIDYILVSPMVTLHLGEQDIDFEDYIQITYVDNGIVRLSHKDGTYQTVSDQSTLKTAGGATLNLVGKGFMDGDELILALDNLAVNDSDYIETDENSDDYESNYQLPTFVVEEGEDGDSGYAGVTGEEGTSGDQGTGGDEGAVGEEGTAGAEGDEGSNGGKGSSGGGGESGYEGESGGDGTSGYDGVEGDSGVMGYDGQNGTSGNSASNAAGSDSIQSVDLNARPTIQLDAYGTDSQYEVNSNSASMTLNLSDTDEALIVGEGKTKVILYNRDTMEMVNSVDNQVELGTMLENGKVALDFQNLSPNTNYLIVVTGEYQATDGVTYDATLFNKVFATNPLGISLTAGEVTDSSVTANVEITDSSISGYTVQYYVLNETGTEVVYATYDVTIASGEANNKHSYSLTQDGTGQVDGSAISGSLINYAKSESFSSLTSNTYYYAKLGSVKVNSAAVDSSSINDLTLKTLKKKPYNKTAYDTNKAAGISNIDYEYVNTMHPTLEGSNSNRTMTINLLDQIGDDDSGIIKYTYELFDAVSYAQYESDITDKTYGISDPAEIAQVTGQVAMPEPAFSKVTESQTVVTFKLPDSSTTKYRARITVTFNNNVNEVTYNTLMSEEVSLQAAETSTLVDITDLQGFKAQQVINNPGESPTTKDITFEVTDSNGITKTLYSYDKVSASVRIKDPNNLIDQYISESTPLKIMIYGEYEDHHENVFNKENVDNNKIKVGDDNLYYKLPFTTDSLHPNCLYSLVVYGPYDTDSNGYLSEAEKLTYLCGYKFRTAAAGDLSLVGISTGNTDQAFSYTIGFTSQVKDSYGNNVSTQAEINNCSTSTMTGTPYSFYKYETGTLSKLTLVLEHTDTAGAVTELGSAAIFNNQNSASQHQDGSFRDHWLDRDNVDTNKDKDSEGNELGGLVLASTSSLTSLTSNGWGKYDDKNNLYYTVTPESFGINAQDSRLFTGGVYTIRVKSAEDYSGVSIPFNLDENYISFSIDEKHLKATDPNKQVEVNTISKAAASGDFSSTFADYKDEAIVGFRIQSNYDYNDFGDYVDNVDGLNYPLVYTIYEVQDKDINSANKDDKETVEDGYLFAGNDKLKPVLVVETDRKDPIELYFEGTKVKSTGTNQSTKCYSGSDYYNYWYCNPDSPVSKPSVLAENTTILKRGKSYIVSYFVNTNGKIKCKDTGINDVYPNCTFDIYRGTSAHPYQNKNSSGVELSFADVAKTEMPLYRSRIITTTRQVPFIERYRVASGGVNNSSYTGDGYIEYKYRIYDPDEALVRTEKDAQGNAGTDLITLTVTGYSTTNYLANNKPVGGNYTFTEIISLSDFTNLNTLKVGGGKSTGDGNPLLSSYKKAGLRNTFYYTVSMKYKLSEFADEQTLVSLGDRFDNEVSSETEQEAYKQKSSGAIRLMGQTAPSDVTKENLTEGDSNYNADKAKLYELLEVYNNSTGVAEEKIYYKPVYNEGGYRIRITVRGNNIRNYAAYRVIVTGLDKSTGNPDTSKRVVYDPVYMSGDVQQTKASDNQEYFGYLYLDASALSSFAKDVDKIRIEVQGYYRTNNVGIGSDFEAKSDKFANYKNKAFNTNSNLGAADYSNYNENLYIFANYSNGLDYIDYLYYGYDASSLSWGSSIAGSLFVPGPGASAEGGDDKTKGLSAIKTNTGEKYKNTEADLSLRRTLLPLAVATDADDNYPADKYSVKIDENGITDGTNYYTAEKLKLGNKLYDGKKSQQYYDVELGDILPATENTASSVGVTSFTYKIAIPGGSDESKIYARIYQNTRDGNKNVISSNPLALIKNGTGDDAYYTVDTSKVKTETEDTVTPTYDYINYKDSYLPKYTTDGGASARTFTVRGLTKGTNYYIVFFTYTDTDTASPKYRELYSIDGGITGYKYSITTADTVKVALGTPTWIYNKYQDKYGLLKFGLPGSEGTGIDIKYQICTQEGSPLCEQTYINHCNEGGSYKYYSSDADVNESIKVRINPGTQSEIGTGSASDVNLAINTEYKIKMYIYEAGSADLLSTQEFEFTTPSVFNSQSIYATATQSTVKVGDVDKINLTLKISMKDLQKAFVNDQYYISVKKGTTSVRPEGDIVKSRVNNGLVPEYSTYIIKLGDEGVYLDSGNNYSISIYAKRDVNNNGTADNTFKYDFMVAANNSVTATVGASANTSKININLTNTQQFASQQVNKIIVSAYSRDDGSILYQKELIPSSQEVTAATKKSEDNLYFATSDPSNITLELPWSSGWLGGESAVMAGNYDVKISYYNGDTLVGNDATSVRVTN